MTNRRLDAEKEALSGKDKSEDDIPGQCEVPRCERPVDFVSPRYWCEKHWNLWTDFPVDHEGEQEPEWMEPRSHCYCCGDRRPPFHPDLPEGSVFVSMYEAEGSGTGDGCRAIVICSTCFRKGDFDMWTDEAEWDSKSPVVPYRLLPPCDHDDPERERVSKYPPPKELLKADGN